MNGDVTLLKNVNTSTGEEATDDRVLSEIDPSCNDCVATIVTEQFTQTVWDRVLGQRGQPSGKEIRVLFPRIQESGEVSRPELKLFYTNF